MENVYTIDDYKDELHAYYMGLSKNYTQYTKEDYLTFEWRVRSAQIKARDNNQCQVCGKIYNLNVHHILYVPGWPVWDYPDRYLITLCEFHHGFEHCALLFIDKAKHKEALLSGILAQDMINNKSLNYGK